MRNLRYQFGMLWLCLWLMSGLSAFAFAQDAPAPVQTALDDLNRQTGQSLRLGSFPYTWSEQVYNGDNLGCPNVQQNNSGTYRAYLIRFDTDFDGIYEWEYRVSLDGTIFILCARPAVVPSLDPSIPTATPARCNGLSPRLVIGQSGRVLPGDPNLLRDIPSRSGTLLGEIPGEGVFTILDGPRCTNELTWWQVNYNGIIGWTVESNASEYWVEPFDPAAIPPTFTAVPNNQIVPILAAEPCNALPPRLAIGELGRVTPGLANNVRDVPSRSGTKVGEIPGGAEFEVVNGPICADGMLWWEVRYADVFGWTVEGLGDEYFLVPPTIYEPITVDNAFSVEPLFQSPVDDPRLTAVRGFAFDTRLAFRASTDTQITLWGIYRDLYDPFFAFNQVTLSELGASDVSIDVLHAITPKDTLGAQITPDTVLIYSMISPTPLSALPAAAERVVFAPSSSLVGVVETSGMVSVWTTDTVVPLVSIDYTGQTVDLAFTADSSHLLVAVDNLIEVWAVSSWQTIGVLQSDLYNQQLVVSPDNRWLAITGTTAPAGGSYANRLWDLGTQTLRWGINADGAEYLSRPVFTQDSSAMVTLESQTGSRTVRFTEVQSGDIIAGFPVATGDSLAFNHDGTILAVYDQSGASGRVSLWAINSAAQP